MSFVVLRVGGKAQAAGALMAECLILNVNTPRAPSSLVCVLCCCWQYRADSTSGIIAGPQCLSPPPGYALCTISCSLGRKRPATALSYCQSFMMHHLTHSAHVHPNVDERAVSVGNVCCPQLAFCSLKVGHIIKMTKLQNIINLYGISTKTTSAVIQM